jgi:L-fuconolactonase
MTDTSPVVDGQVHINLLGTVDAAVVAMDAVGVDAVVIDEWWGYDPAGIRLPHYKVGDGAARHLYPFSTEAACRYPDRFAYTAWVDPKDPELDAVMTDIAANPQQVAIRIVLRSDLGDDIALESGVYDKEFELAAELGIPIKVILASTDMTRRLDVLSRAMERHESVQFIVDHCGVVILSAADVARGLKQPKTLELPIAYARLPNVAILWCHAPTLSAEPYPYRDVLAYLRRFVDEFGADRVMWASDPTHNFGHHTWAEALFCVKDTDVISQAEKDLVLGGTARRIFSWPPADSEAGSRALEYTASSWRAQPMQAVKADLHDRRRR